MARQRRTPQLEDPVRFSRRMQDKLGTLAARRAKRITRSRTMRRSIQAVRDGNDVLVGVPHHWAVHYHDGRGNVHPRQKRWLVFFDKPERDDPRLSNGYPVRKSDTRRLTRAEWDEGLRKNRLRAKRKQKPFMIVVRRTGPTIPGITDDRFLDEAFLHIKSEAHAIVRPDFLKMIDGVARVREESTAKAKL